MNKPVLLLLSALLLPANALAFDIPFFGGGDKDKDAPASEEVVTKGQKKYIVHFKSGGTIQTDNYSITDNNIVIMMPAGAIYLDRDSVESIEEVKGAELESVKTIQVSPDEAVAPGKPEESPAEDEAPQPQEPEVSNMERDDNGNTEQWWNARVDEWVKKLGEAEERFTESENDWNRYDGQIGALGEETPDYERTRLQDLRGSARVNMDRAQADIEDAKRMLDEVLPEEARKAGAPPGWVRY